MNDRMIRIRIMLLVGSNGKAAACVENELDWGDLAANITDYEGAQAKDPTATSRRIITVSVPEPVIAEITGEVSNVQP